MVSRNEQRERKKEEEEETQKQNAKYFPYWKRGFDVSVEMMAQYHVAFTISKSNNGDTEHIHRFGLAFCGKSIKYVMDPSIPGDIFLLPHSLSICSSLGDDS